MTELKIDDTVARSLLNHKLSSECDRGLNLRESSLIASLSGAGFVGYVAGKVSYQGECRRKILALPDSRLADALRQRSGLRQSEEM